MPGLSLIDAGSRHYLLSHDYQRCLQVLPNVPLGTKSPLVEKPRYSRTLFLPWCFLLLILGISLLLVSFLYTYCSFSLCLAGSSLPGFLMSTPLSWAPHSSIQWLLDIFTQIYSRQFELSMSTVELLISAILPWSPSAAILISFDGSPCCQAKTLQSCVTYLFLSSLTCNPWGSPVGSTFPIYSASDLFLLSPLLSSSSLAQFSAEAWYLVSKLLPFCP